VTRRLFVPAALGLLCHGGLALPEHVAHGSAPARLTEPRIAIKTENAVAACLEVGSPLIKASGNLLLADSTLRFKKTLGTCGCTSALLRYSVLETVAVAGGPGVEYERSSGRFRARSSGQRRFSFVISTDADINTSGPLTLRVGCAGAD
jgi:hypothetical protein